MGSVALRSGRNYIAVVPSRNIAGEIRSKLICDQSEDEDTDKNTFEEQESNELEQD